MKRFLTILIIASTLQVYGQEFNTSLYGFRLGQYREAAKTELGKPFKAGKYDDGYEYEVFTLKPDTSLYIVFEYAKQDTGIIWSIQVSGSNSTTEIGLKGIKLGLNTTDVEKIIGKPSSVKDIGEYGSMWNYNNKNLSVEVNKEGKLSSVKILDITHELFPKGPDVKKIPSFDAIRKTLNTNDDAELLKLLAGDIEVYYKNEIYYFKKSILTEQATDYSKVLSTIKMLSKDLGSVNTKNLDEYEENMRVALGARYKACY